MKKLLAVLLLVVLIGLVTATSVFTLRAANQKGLMDKVYQEGAQVFNSPTLTIVREGKTIAVAYEHANRLYADGAGASSLEEAIDIYVRRQAEARLAEQSGVVITDDDVNAYIEMIKTAFEDDEEGKQDFLTMLEAYGFTEAEYFENSFETYRRRLRIAAFWGKEKEKNPKLEADADAFRVFANAMIDDYIDKDDVRVVEKTVKNAQHRKS